MISVPLLASVDVVFLVSKYLLELEAFGPPPLLPSNVFIVTVLLGATCALFWYKGHYKRSLFEQHDHDDQLQHSLLSPVHNNHHEAE